MFSDAQVKMLSADLDSRHVKQRSQSGRSLSYLEGWHVISEANRIFGFSAWNRETVDVRCVAEHPRKIGKDPKFQKDGHSVSYVAKVRVDVSGIVREGWGAGHGIDVDLGLAHESAIKEAETDAMKRALMTFGNPFGLALYDKTQANVSAPPAPPSEAFIAAKADLDACATVAELATVWGGKAKGYGHILSDADWADLVAHKDALKTTLAKTDQSEPTERAA